jgi:hypothetical protein
MDEYFSGDELPHARQIVREDFGDEDFDAGEFLMKFHQFQTLSDLQKQLKSWDNVLSNELIEIINEEFSDFVALGRMLGKGELKSRDVKTEVERFRGEVSAIQDDMKARVTMADMLLQEKRQLSNLEVQTHALLCYLERLDDVEMQIQALAHQSLSVPAMKEDLERAAKTFCALDSLTPYVKGHSSIVATSGRVAKLRGDILSLCRRELSFSQQSGDTDYTLKLVALVRRVA